MLGSIPILHDTTLNELYEDLPVMFLRQNRLEVLTRKHLKRKYQAVMKKLDSYNWEKLFGFYWLKEVRQSTYLG